MSSSTSRTTHHRCSCKINMKMQPATKQLKHDVGFDVCLFASKSSCFLF